MYKEIALIIDQKLISFRFRNAGIHKKGQDRFAVQKKFLVI